MIFIALILSNPFIFPGFVRRKVIMISHWSNRYGPILWISLNKLGTPNSESPECLWPRLAKRPRFCVEAIYPQKPLTQLNIFIGIFCMSRLYQYFFRLTDITKWFGSGKFKRTAIPDFFWINNQMSTDKCVTKNFEYNEYFSFAKEKKSYFPFFLIFNIFLRFL